MFMTSAPAGYEQPTQTPNVAAGWMCVWGGEGGWREVDGGGEDVWDARGEDRMGGET